MRKRAFTSKVRGSHGCTITKMEPSASYPNGCYQIQSASRIYYENTMAEARELTKYLASSWSGR